MKCMLHIAVVGGLLAGGHVHAQTHPFAAWTHRAAVKAPAPGLARVELSREVMDVSRASDNAGPLGDLRLVNADGVETPLVIEWPPAARRARPGASLAPERFTTSLQGTTTLIEMEIPNGAMVQEARLETGNRDFIKAAVLEGTLDGEQWSVISDRELIFRQGGAERLWLTFPPRAWKKLRISLDDQRSGPAGFTGATLLTHESNEPDEPATTSEEVRILSREETNGETVLKLDLGGRNRPLYSLHITATDPLFQRSVLLEVPHADGSQLSISGDRTIYRIGLDDRRSEDLDLVYQQNIPERQVQLRIINKDNPPLRVEKIEGRFSRIHLLFHAGAAGTWQLFAGNAGAPRPQYDVASLLGDLSRVNVSTASLGILESNPDFRKEAALPQTGEGGAALDVSAWAYRKSVTFSETGVMSVELDAEAMARAAPDQRDVRVMQNGRQVPYFIERGAPLRDVEVVLQQEPDAKHPSVSRWRVSLPFAGYPVSKLDAASPTVLFERQIRVWENGRDSYGNPFRRPLGDTNWRRTSEKGDGALSVSLNSHPAGDVIYLETDNGDNAPLHLSSLRAAFQPVSVIFKAASAAPVQLVYGNPRASAPRYDIQLVRAQFERGERANAELGSEVRAEGFKETRAESPGLGSVWLWVALALVVAGLLWVVAKLMPEAAAK